MGVIETGEGIMDFSAELNGLQQQLAQTKSMVQAATAESRVLDAIDARVNATTLASGAS